MEFSMSNQSPENINHCTRGGFVRLRHNLLMTMAMTTQVPKARNQTAHSWRWGCADRGQTYSPAVWFVRIRPYARLLTKLKALHFFIGLIETNHHDVCRCQREDIHDCRTNRTNTGLDGNIFSMIRSSPRRSSFRLGMIITFCFVTS